MKMKAGDIYFSGGQGSVKGKTTVPKRRDCRTVQ